MAATSLLNKKLILGSTIVALLVTFFFCFISVSQKKQTTQRYHFLHFGTIIQLTLAPTEENLSQQTINKIDELLLKLHYKWHPWRAGELKDLNNNLATLKWFKTNLEIIEIIELSKDLYQKSLHYFNPAIGKLIAYWGFHQDNPINNNNNDNSHKINYAEYLKNLPAPTDIKINYKKLEIKNNNPNLQFDLSGFIKAKAMLEIRNILLAINIKNALINIGGDIYVMGKKNINTPWVIAVNNPKNNTQINLELHNNETISTSGVYARRNSNAEHHLINPKTGRPSEGFDSVTVIHHDPYISDAGATALLIAGKSDYAKVARSMGLEKYILI